MLLLDDTRPPSGKDIKQAVIDVALSAHFLYPSWNQDLEIYFSRSCGFALTTIALMTIVLTGSIPLTSTVAEPISTDDENDPKAPYAVPTLLLTTLFHATCAFYAYSWYVYRGNTVLVVGTVGSTVVASIGLWCLLFGSSGGRINRRTGFDKRTAGFPFKNSKAYKRFPEKTSKNLWGTSYVLLWILG